MGSFHSFLRGMAATQSQHSGGHLQRLHMVWATVLLCLGMLFAVVSVSVSVHSKRDSLASLVRAAVVNLVHAAVIELATERHARQVFVVQVVPSARCCGVAPEGAGLPFVCMSAGLHSALRLQLDCKRGQC